MCKPLFCNQTKWFFSEHPCDKTSNGGCEQTCNKDGESAVCECAAPDYKLGSDGKSCDKGNLLAMMKDGVFV